MLQTVSPVNYIYPPRSQDAMPIDSTLFMQSMGWVAQLKYNDSRCLIKYQPGQKTELWNRHGERFRNYNAPDWLLDQLDEAAQKLGLTGWSLLDGGLLDQKHQAIKDTIVIWDILVRDGQHLLGTPYQERYDLVNKISTVETFNYTSRHHEPVDFGWKVSDNVLVPKNYKDGWLELWNGPIAMVNKPYTVGDDIKPVIEGLVFKNPKGILERGFREKNNSSWMMRSRVQTGRHRF